MKLIVDDSAYFVDREGSTYGITASGEVTVKGEIAGWIQIIAGWVEAGVDVERRADSLDPARAEYVRSVKRAMLKLGVLREAPVAGPVRFLGVSSTLQQAAELSGRPLPESCLAIGPSSGDWLLDDVRAHPRQTYGAVLLEGDSAVIVGPAVGAALAPVLIAIRERGGRTGRPTDAVEQLAIAQLVRRVTASPADPWRATTVTSDGSLPTRINAHPWQEEQPVATGSFDERAMTLVDPEYGVIRLVEEADLPQVPRHRSRARVSCGAVFDRVDVEVVGHGADHDAARRDAVRMALAARAESSIDPRRVRDASGAPAAHQNATMTQLHAAARRVAAEPHAFSVIGRLLSDGSEVRVPVEAAYRCTDDAASVGCMGVGETADEALGRALLGLIAEMPVDRQESEAQPLSYQEAARVAVVAHPRAVVVDLDHDPAPRRVGLVVRKVLVLS